MKKLVFLLLVSSLYASKKDVYTVCLNDGSKCYNDIIIKKDSAGSYLSFYINENGKLKLVTINGKYTFIPYK